MFVCVLLSCFVWCVVCVCFVCALMCDVIWFVLRGCLLSVISFMCLCGFSVNYRVMLYALGVCVVLCVCLRVCV